jgi:hypothetical protein
LLENIFKKKHNFKGWQNSGLPRETSRRRGEPLERYEILSVDDILYHLKRLQ